MVIKNLQDATRVEWNLLHYKKTFERLKKMLKSFNDELTLTLKDKRPQPESESLIYEFIKMPKKLNSTNVVELDFSGLKGFSAIVVKHANHRDNISDKGSISDSESDGGSEKSTDCDTTKDSLNKSTKGCVYKEEITFNTDGDVFDFLKYGCNTIVVPSVVNYSDQEDMKVRIVLGEEKEKYEKLEESLIKASKNIKSPVKANTISSL
jgi:hypothetical protein